MSKPVQAAGLEHIELERLRIRVGRLFAALQEAAAETAAAVPGMLLPPVDLCETKDEVVVRVELPGVEAEAVEVILTSTQLRVSGRKKKGAPRGRIAHLCSERSYGHFSRAVPLRWAVSAPDATAELRQGVLTVRLPKLKDRRGVEFKVTVKGNDE